MQKIRTEYDFEPEVETRIINNILRVQKHFKTGNFPEIEVIEIAGSISSKPKKRIELVWKYWDTKVIVLLEPIDATGYETNEKEISVQYSNLDDGRTVGKSAKRRIKSTEFQQKKISLCDGCDGLFLGRALKLVEHEILTNEKWLCRNCRDE